HPVLPQESVGIRLVRRATRAGGTNYLAPVIDVPGDAEHIAWEHPEFGHNPVLPEEGMRHAGGGGISLANDLSLLVDGPRKSRSSAKGAEINRCALCALGPESGMRRAGIRSGKAGDLARLVDARAFVKIAPAGKWREL